MNKKTLLFFFLLLFVGYSFQLTVEIERDGTCTIYSKESIVELKPYFFKKENNYYIYKTQSFTNKKGNVWTFVFPFDANVIFSEEIKIKNVENVKEISFYENKVVVEGKKGGKIEYVFIIHNKVTYEIIVFITIGLLSFFVAGVIFLKKKREKIGEKEGAQNKDFLRLLSENEKKVYEEIEKREGITQKELCSLLNLPKSTVSTIVKKLENKGLIKKAKVGLSTKLYVNK